MKKDKSMLLDLTNKLVDRLNEINDESYKIIDNISQIFKEL